MRKERVIIRDERYLGSKTVPLIFHFEQIDEPSSRARLENCSVVRKEIAGKELYIFDGLFSEEEGRLLKEVTEKARFTTKIFGDYGAEAKGEEAALALGGREKWAFFSNPPSPILELYKLFAFLGQQTCATVTTQPWELYGEKDCYTPTFATNLIKNFSPHSEQMDKHRDYSTERGIPWDIPQLFEEGLHPFSFINGSIGRPWLITVMLYATSTNFIPENGLGTYFCKDDGEIVFREQCRSMRCIFFEGDIIHGVTQSTVDNPDAWRISYVFKLVFNPHRKLSLKEAFRSVLCKFNSL